MIEFSSRTPNDLVNMERPTSREIEKALSRWRIPEVPKDLKAIIGIPDSVNEMGRRLKRGLSRIEDPEEGARLESKAADWLSDLVRGNIKRGRVFQLGEVLSFGYADCLGYSLLLQTLGILFGLDIGVVEVVIDNAGRYVPHHVDLFTPSIGRGRFIDLWYGSRDIYHRRLGACVREGGKWRVRDIDRGELEEIEDIRGLPEGCLDAILCYILGNRHLEGGITSREKREFEMAIGYYNEAIRLYPGNSRAYFNRAVAYDNMGDEGTAQIDYAEALKDEASVIRVLAREYEEIVQLIELDGMGIGPGEQEIYLLRNGFITGRMERPADIARECAISESEVDRILSQIEDLMGL